MAERIEFDDLFAQGLTNEINALQESIEELSKTIEKGLTKAFDRNKKAAKGWAEELKDVSASDLPDKLKQTKKELADVTRQQANLEAASKQANKALEEEGESVNTLKAQAKALTAEYNSLNVKTKEGAARAEELADELVTTKKRINELNEATRKTNNVFKTLDGSYDSLVKRNKTLKEELRRLPDGFDATSKAANRLKREIRENTEQLKRFDKELGESFRNVGNYASALQRAGKASSDLTSKLNVGAQALNFGSKIVDEFGKTEEGSKVLNAITSRFNAAVRTGAKLVDDLADDQTTLSEAVENVSQNYSETQENLEDASNAQRDLIRTSADLIKQVADENKIFEERIALADDDTASLSDRIEAAEKAVMSFESLAASAVKSAEAQVEIADLIADESIPETILAQAEAYERLVEAQTLGTAGLTDLRAILGLLKIDLAEQALDFQIDQLIESSDASLRLAGSYTEVSKSQQAFREGLIALTERELPALTGFALEFRKLQGAIELGDPNQIRAFANELGLSSKSMQEILDIAQRLDGIESFFDIDDLTLVQDIANDLELSEREVNRLIELTREWRLNNQAVVDQTAAITQNLRDAANFAFSQIAGDVTQEFFDRQRAQIEEQEEFITASEQRRLEQFEGNESAKRQITKDADRQREVLARKAAQQEKAAALFSIAINTARGVVAALASLPPNVPLSIAIGATGAIQAGIVASRPVPAFAKGTDDSPAGVAVVGEAGRELVVTPSGTVSLAANPQLIDLPAHSQVIPNSETETILRMLNAGSDLPDLTQDKIDLTPVLRQLERNKEAYENRPEHVTAITNGQLETFYRKRGNEIRYYNERY